jgi:2-C-methyl-D-erythritol 4-phosphate cytidylyltransferase
MPGEGPSVEALILAAGRGERLGLGPKALLALGGRTLLERAIALMRSVAERVLVGVPEEYVGELRRAIPAEGVRVVPGGGTRTETFLRLFEASTAPLLVQHDVVHPFATVDLAKRVVAAAERTGAAMGVARVAEHVYRGEANVTARVPTGGAMWLARKPLAFKRSAFARALEGGAPAPGAGTVELLLAAGQPVEPVVVEPWNIKLTTPEDWALAVALDALLPLPAPPSPAEPLRRG